MTLYHVFAVDVHSGKLLQDYEFELFEYGKDGVIRRRRYRGAWMLVDNGYLKWPSNIPPFKDPVYVWEYKWSEIAETLRKDVECTFGIMKGRFRQLKTGTRLHGHIATDKIWLTCCALHNMLLEVDGLDEEMEYWEGNIGLREKYCVDSFLPEAICNRMEREGENIYATDFPGEGRGEDVIVSDEDNNEGKCEGTIPSDDDPSIRVVNELSRDYFRTKLVEHFKIRWGNNDV